MPKNKDAFSEVIEFEDPAIANELFGPRNSNLEILTNASGAKISSKGASVLLECEDEKNGKVLCNLFLQLYSLGRKGLFIHPQDLGRSYDMLKNDPGLDLGQVFRDAVFVQTPRKTVNARNVAQKQYLDALKKNELVFAVGPAGTGKTYLAVAMAISMLQKHRIKKIILCRPAVEAGERLGFLPGDLAEKVNPYLRPLYDALYDMTPQAKVESMIQTGVIEIAPLAFMRGRTLNDAFIILDEAQNTTQEQMKMFLTRMGFGSRMAVTGDVTQIDLPQTAGDNRPRSGLVHALNLLKNVNGLAIHTFTKADVVRHPLVGSIVSAYDEAEKGLQAR
ncbi:MAG: PhoH family protein [Desulfovibrio sp.]|nr:PhoH family protein [Desulfovibrio sp.]